MTSKPTAQERYQQIKNTPFGSTEDAVNEISFLISLVEAAVKINRGAILSPPRTKMHDMADADEFFWKEANQRMAEKERI